MGSVWRGLEGIGSGGAWRGLERAWKGPPRWFPGAPTPMPVPLAVAVAVACARACRPAAALSLPAPDPPPGLSLPAPPAEARMALQQKRSELMAECEANSKLQRRFDQINAQVRRWPAWKCCL